MIDPETMLLWLDRRIASAENWVETFGSGRKARPSYEVEQKMFDIQALSEIKTAYLKAVKRKNEMENRNGENS